MEPITLEIELDDLPPLADEHSVAELLGLKVATLRKWRLVGAGPRFVKVGRLVKYPRPEVRRWLEGGGDR